MISTLTVNNLWTMGTRPGGAILAPSAGGSMGSKTASYGLSFGGLKL
jgi:hypothetical protein